MNYRNELKYIMDKTKSEMLKYELGFIMNIDKFATKDNTYLIKSLYFDDMYNSAYYEKVNGVENRKKYRIRVYNDDYNFIRLECKYKINNKTSKKQTLISKKEYDKIINDKVEDIRNDNELLNNFLLEYKLKKIRPSVVVEYKRFALTYPVSDVRITFDYNIKSSLYDIDLFDKISNKQEVLDNNLVIVEVKYNEFIPNIICNILSSFSLSRQAYSKYSSCIDVK